MAADVKVEDYVYRISTAKEWEELQKNGSAYGGDLDRSSGFIHLSKLDQVQSTLQNFFKSTNLDLYLLQIDAKKRSDVAALGWRQSIQDHDSLQLQLTGQLPIEPLGDGLIYEVVDGCHTMWQLVKYALENPFMACSGHGGPPNNYDVEAKVRPAWLQNVEEYISSQAIIWDGVSSSELVNHVVASSN